MQHEDSQENTLRMLAWIDFANKRLALLVPEDEYCIVAGGLKGKRGAFLLGHNGQIMAEYDDDYDCAIIGLLKSIEWLFEEQLGIRLPPAGMTPGGFDWDVT